MEHQDASKVTSDKPKNPGRQEWGRKLGKMSKELKLKKQQEASEQVTSSKVKLKYYMAAAATVLIGIAALYYRKKVLHVQRKVQKQVSESTPVSKTRFSDF